MLQFAVWDEPVSSHGGTRDGDATINLAWPVPRAQVLGQPLYTSSLGTITKKPRSTWHGPCAVH